MKNIHNFFKEKQLCKVWPSSDPDDRPFTEYTCRICEEVLTLQTAGTWMMGEPSLFDRMDAALRAHLFGHCGEEFLTKHVHTDPLKAGPAFDILLERELEKIKKDET